MRQIPAAWAIVVIMTAMVFGPCPARVTAEDTRWVDQRVVTRYGTVLKVGNTVVDDEGRGRNLAVSGRDQRTLRVYRVERFKSPWMWVTAETTGVKGWVKVDEVMTLDQAIEEAT